MELAFVFISVLTLASAIAAMTLRNLVHCALCLVITFSGLAALFLQLDAQFVGFAQILVYAGAVAILIVFATLLTRSSETSQQPIASRSWLMGAAVAALTFGLLATTIIASSVTERSGVNKPTVTVEKIGTQLMAQYVLPLEVIGLLLTAAMLGAVIIAMQEKKS
jgi:NADH-quinone oxidoreductase subunit J